MKQIKLNLGAGNDHKSGWINADIDPSTNPDKIVDLSNPLPFKNNQAHEVLMQDVFEHFTKEDGQALLQEIHRVMRVGALLIIRIPNVFQIVEQFSDDPEVMMEFLYGTTKENGVWGAHKAGYTPEMIEKTLNTLGFRNIRIKKETTNLVISCKKAVLKKKDPKILILQQAPDWGGAEEWMFSLAKFFKSKSIEVQAATNFSTLKNKFESVGISTAHTPFTLDIIGDYKGLIKSILLFPYATHWYFRKLVSYKKQGINIILMSGFSEKLLVTWIAKFLGISVVWYEYGPLSQVFKRNLYLPKVLYRLTKYIPKKVITISNHTKNTLIEDAKISLAKLEMIYPGTKIPSKNPQTISSPIVGHLSRITPEKGQRLLLQAWKKVVKKIPNAKLLIAGKGPDEKHLKSLAKELGIEESVEFLGFIKDKSKFYSKLKLFIFPSIWQMEGFGIVQIEALAHGVPVVSISNGPAGEIINSSVGSLAGKNVDDLSKAIIKELKTKKSKSIQARSRAKEIFDINIQAEKVLQLIKDTVYEVK